MSTISTPISLERRLSSSGRMLSAAAVVVCYLAGASLAFGGVGVQVQKPAPGTTPSPQPDARTADSGSSLYIELQLAGPVKVSKLKPGDVLQGKLSRDVYQGDRELFQAASPVRLTVGKLERRKREPNDHWPGIIKLFTPRHQNYPTLRSVSVSLPGGGEVPIQATLVSISHRVQVHAKPKATKSEPSVGPGPQTTQASTGPVSGTAPAAAPTGSGTTTGGKPPKPGQTVILEATDFVPGQLSALAANPAPPILATLAQPVTLATGTRAQVVLLGSLSASKSHPGDSFRARLLEPVRIGSRIVLPEGILFEGKVVKATPPRWLSRPGSLNLTFTGFTLPEGTGSPVMATLAGAELDPRSRTRIDSEGGLSGGHPGKAWMLINLGVAAGIAKESDDGLQLVIEAIVSTATDASTAGVARIFAACTSGIYMVTRRGRDVVLPRFTEMDITFNRPLSVPEPQSPAAGGAEDTGGRASRANPASK
ncbi:MAG TPA: hypothetical protein VI455_04565 [Terriglobia bacterium]